MNEKTAIMPIDSPEADQQLQEFKEWAGKNPPRETSRAEIERLATAMHVKVPAFILISKEIADLAESSNHRSKFFQTSVETGRALAIAVARLREGSMSPEAALQDIGDIADIWSALFQEIVPYEEIPDWDWLRCSGCYGLSTAAAIGSYGGSCPHCDQRDITWEGIKDDDK